MTIDVGTGDGRAVLAAATREPTIFAIGLDADARSMAEASRRAARAPGKGGLSNALFVVAAAEAAPADLCAVASRVTVRFPWASLLRGCLGTDRAVAAGVAGLVRPGGSLELLLAPAERDRLEALPTAPAAVIEAAVGAFARYGFSLVEAREAMPEDLDQSGSTWSRRLLRGGGASSARRPVLVRLQSP